MLRSPVHAHGFCCKETPFAIADLAAQFLQDGHQINARRPLLLCHGSSPAGITSSSAPASAATVNVVRAIRPGPAASDYETSHSNLVGCFLEGEAPAEPGTGLGRSLALQQTTHTVSVVDL